MTQSSIISCVTLPGLALSTSDLAPSSSLPHFTSLHHFHLFLHSALLRGIKSKSSSWISDLTSDLFTLQQQPHYLTTGHTPKWPPSTICIWLLAITHITH